MGEFGSSSTIVVGLTGLLNLDTAATFNDPVKAAKSRNTPPLLAWRYDTTPSLFDGVKVKYTPPIDNVKAGGRNGDSPDDDNGRPADEILLSVADSAEVVIKVGMVSNKCQVCLVS